MYYSSVTIFKTIDHPNTQNPQNQELTFHEAYRCLSQP
ncbi:hypothetical protein OKW21_006167 [Catalinimonas alkaloidigena]|nr:hypothetical protein [Catalinimonas alkaloidigena]